MVLRALPSGPIRNVGPFVFFDAFGPTALQPGRGMDVRPHPHIGLATVTYLLEGEILHRDSLGTQARIRPGASWASNAVNASTMRNEPARRSRLPSRRAGRR